MILRILSSISAGFLMATALLYVMHLLIETGEEVYSEPRPIIRLSPWREMTDLPDAPEVESPVRIDDPLPPPSTALENDNSGSQVNVRVPVPSVGVPPTDRDFHFFFTSDGPLINIYKVSPQYPVTAQNRGLEGSVLVEYDVSNLGSVENVIVVETTNRLFNQAAIQAAYRFRYKPRVVDGMQLGVSGLQQLFSFTMPE